MGGQDDPFATHLTIQALGFATGAVLCAMLGLLHWKSARHAEGARLHLTFWLVGLLWTLGRFAEKTLLLAGWPAGSGPVELAGIVAFSATGFGPLIFSQSFSREAPSASPLRRMMLALALLNTAGLLVLFAGTALAPKVFPPVETVAMAAFFSTLASLAIFGGVYLAYPRAKRRPMPSVRGVRWFYVAGAALILFEAYAIAGALRIPDTLAPLREVFGVAAPQWPIPAAILGAAFLARRDYADVVLKRSLVVLASVLTGTLLIWWLPLPRGIPVVLAALSVAALLLLAPALHRGLDRLVDKGLLRRPDYAALAKAFAGEARRAPDRDTLLALVCRHVGEALNVEARIASDGQPVAALASLVVDETQGKAGIIELHAKSEGRALLRGEREFIAAIVSETQHRLEVIESERLRRETQLNEERLARVATEAELKALRAQVDPHFLFNTLNSIASLVSTDPAKAEEMTERLAEFFRYTLARQERMFSTLDEELDFTRQYLAIEQVRFGDRLHVEFSKGQGLGAQSVPSLILQPLVENAVRHGLAPKREGGRISVSATRENGCLELVVMDDGVGMPGGKTERAGIGLQNVRARLQTFYGEASRMSIDPGAQGRGTRVKLVLPAT